MNRWKFSLLATAAALSTGLHLTDASALALGRITVQSALGEPLRAEIELPQITPAEADSLRVTTAAPEVFRAQGLEYSTTVRGIQVQLQRRANGSAVVQLSSSSAINDPFVDLVIDASWSAGHIVRSYTLLLDPPGLRRAPAAVSAAPQVEASPRATTAAPARATTAPVRAPAAAPAQAPAARTAAPAPAAAPAHAPSQVTVRSGDTAGAIASAHRPSGISLDQMLVAMLRANPQAFIDGNVNRVRAGAVLQMPGAGEAQATSAAEARQIIAAQSQDFNEFRRRLAGAAPTAPVEAAERSASGKVRAQVAESKPEAASVDKLTLSKGDAGAAATDAQMAQARQADQSAARKAELAKNISELKQLSDSAASSAPPAAPEAGVPVPAPAAPAQDAATAAPAAAAPEPAAPAAEAATSPAAEAPAPAPQAPAAAAPAPAPAEEPGLLDFLKQDPLTSGGIAALLLALLGWVGYRAAQRKRTQEGPETAFADNRDSTDSFFAASGGQQVDTTNNDLTTGSTLYTPSQLDTDGEVDPIAEASVYLAYGKDVEAEHILREAAAHHPEQVSIQAKLAEIHAKRQDRAALQATAQQVLNLTQGQGPDWARMLELGRAIDPDNALYQAVPSVEPAAMAHAAEEDPSTLIQETSGPDSKLPDLDLDLDLGSAGLPEPAATPSAASAPGAFAAAVATAAAQHAAMPASAPAALENPSDADMLTLPAAHEPAAAPPAEALDFHISGLSMLDSGSAPLARQDAAPSGPAPLEFDLGALSLDLDGAGANAAPVPQPPAADEPLPSDPLGTKLALAEEFKAIGDSEGARALIQEVLAEAAGELKDKAQRLMATLG